MGDFTKLSLDAAQKIIDLYGLGKIIAFNAQSQGISNSNYRVDLRGKKSVLLKVSNDKDINELQKELDVLERLDALHFHYSLLPLRAKDNKLYYQYDDFVGVIFPFLTAVVLKPTEDSVRQIGTGLAELHQNTMNVDLDDLRSVYEVTYGPRDIQRFTNTPVCPAEFKEAYSKLGGHQLIDEYKEMDGRICLVHGDLYFDNCLFHQQKLLTMLDFEQSGRGEMLLDLGISLSGSCLNLEGHIDQNLLSSYLGGYQSLNPLNKDELDFLDHAILIGLMSISLWRIYRFTIGGLDKSRKESYVELLKRALQYREQIYE